MGGIELEEDKYYFYRAGNLCKLHFSDSYKEKRKVKEMSSRTFTFSLSFLCRNGVRMIRCKSVAFIILTMLFSVDTLRSRIHHLRTALSVMLMFRTSLMKIIMEKLEKTQIKTKIKIEIDDLEPNFL